MSFELLKLGLKTDNVDINRFANLFHQDGSKLDDFWERIYNLGIQHVVAAIQFDGLQQLIDANNNHPFPLPDKKLKLKW